jgi:hypothetical protein
MVTYDEIVAKSGTNEAAIRKDNPEFFERFSNPAWFIDNLILDHYNWAIIRGETGAVDAAKIEKVLSAARVIAARHPDKSLAYDIEGSYTEFGSPWFCDGLSPEEYAMVFARQSLEGCSEAVIELSERTPQLAQKMGDLIQAMMSAGIPQSVIAENFYTIGYAEHVSESDDEINAVYVEDAREEIRATRDAERVWFAQVEATVGFGPKQGQ